MGRHGFVVFSDFFYFFLIWRFIFSCTSNSSFRSLNWSLEQEDNDLRRNEWLLSEIHCPSDAIYDRPVLAAMYSYP
jgi:hypothetical protein